MQENESESLRRARRRVSAARHLTLLFVLFGIVWIVVTSWIGGALFGGGEAWVGFETAKGIAFVFVSALLIHFVIARHARRILQSEIDSLAQLRDRERRLEILVNGVRDHIISLLSRDGTILTWNEGAERVTGYPAQEAIGSRISSLVGGSQQMIEQIGEDRGATASHAGRRERILWKRRDASELWAEGAIFPVHDERGATLYFAAVFRDLSEILELEKEREWSEEERNRMRTQLERLTRIESLGKLAGTMAHEFNNVLMGIQPFTEVIEKFGADDSRILQANSYIAAAVQRGKRTTEEILRFARPSELQRRLVPVERLLANIEKLSHGIFGAHHEIEIEPIAEQLLVQIDLEQMHQVFSNLLINARDAMPDGGSVMIRVERCSPRQRFTFGVISDSERFVRFEIRDTGTGFSEQVRKYLFEPMFTTKRTGTGLGLAIVHQIITAHGGYIFAESRKGEGSIFHVFLPIGLPSDGDEIENGA